jgi:hypothetical protein
LFNESDSLIWIGSPNLNEVVNALNQAGNVFLDRFILNFIQQLSAFDFNRAEWRDITAFFRRNSVRGGPFADLVLSGGRKSEKQAPWGRLLSYLKTFQDREQLSNVVGSAIAAGSMQDKIALLSNEAGVRSSIPAATVRVDWDTYSKGFTDPASMISSMIDLVGLRHEEMQFRGGRGWANPSEATTNERLLSLLAGSAATVPMANDAFAFHADGSEFDRVQSVRGLCSAMSWALMVLCHRNTLFLPLTFYGLRKAQFTASEPEWVSIAKHFALASNDSRIVFQRLIQSTNISNAEDLSIDLCQAILRSGETLKASVTPGITATIHRFQAENPDKPKFPVAQINLRRHRARTQQAPTLWSESWFDENGFADWAAVAKSLPLTHKGVLNKAQMTLGRLFEWTNTVGLLSPWTVQPIHLINPLDPLDQSTFAQYLSTRYPDKSGAAQHWAGAATFYKRTINAFKPLPAYDSISIRNPFDGLINPFRFASKRTPIGKTYRRLIPADHLEAMIDALLDVNEAGVPTFNWVKQHLSQDTAERYNHATGKFEVVWHPYRTICLAILLLIPLRGKQARWLDEGLMDEMRWDVCSNTFVPNTHILREFRYPDGQSHQTRYGRDSGVLQPIEGLLGSNTQHIGLYISTNKTQLWNPDARTGYAIPWPDGKELLASDDVRIRDQGKRLGLVYELIKQQLRWLQAYDPNPVPVDFSIEQNRYDSATAERFPKFCSIFRDLLSPVQDRTGTSVFPPVTRTKIEYLYHEVAAEAERRLIEKGWPRDAVRLTVQVRNCKNSTPPVVTKCSYDLHSLRVAGITHLLEMGVPAHIVSEFIAGHMALVMTLHYAKFQPLKLRQKILDVFRESAAIEVFEDICTRTGPAIESLLVRNSRYSADEMPVIADLVDARSAWRYLNGGICPGGSCAEGGTQFTRKGGEITQDVEVCPVPGGNEACGNCRLFMTGPAFLIPQMLTANSIMLKMRQFGHARKKLWDDKAALELAVFEKAKGNPMPTSELATITGELERIDRALEPMILEWCNRYEMFQASIRLLDDWTRLSTGNETAGQEKLVLFGSASQNELSATLDPTGCDFSLTKQIVLQSELLGGRRMINELADFKLREFVDRILIREDVRDLMIGISDEKQRRTAALMMAEAISVFAGGDLAVQNILDANAALVVTPEQRGLLSELAHSVSCTDGIEFRHDGILTPIQLLENAA